MSRRLASRNVVAIALLVGIGTGCGNATSGCSSLKPLPNGPAPFNLPSSQMVEGGVQARITSQGMKKLSAIIENVLSSSLSTATACMIPENDIAGTYGQSPGWISLCPVKPAACSAAACGASIIFDSAQRPAPWNIQDNIDHISFSMADGSNPVLNVAASFDLDLPILLDYELDAVVSETKCTLDFYTPHYRGDATTQNLSMSVPIQLGIDPTTGSLTITTQPIQVTSLALQLAPSNCGDLQTAFNLLASGFNAFTSALNSQVGNFFVNLATTALQPQINQLVQGFLPKPLGLASTIDTGTMLASHSAPPTAGLETYLVPGGYVSSKNNGLTLGVMAGMNSDHDPTTRGPNDSSEPDPCVPTRNAPQLGAAPWNLPPNAARMDFTLTAANQFAGNPDPVDQFGATRDVLLGLSRTYLDLIGFHLYNSGTMCLHVDGSSISQLSVGTLGIVMPSLQNISTNPKASIQLVLRPQKPVTFTLGAGTDADALIHMAINDLRVDLYSWVEDRWVRILTIGLDLNLGLNLTVTKDANMNPVLQPMLTGISMNNVGVTITNTDLLSETPASLEQTLPSIISIAAGALTGALPKFALPSLAGFSLADLDIERVQSSQDDFLGLFATLNTPSSPAPLIDWSDPAHPRLAGELRTHATIASKWVPSQDQMGKLLDPSVSPAIPRPSVTLALSADDANGRLVEYAWKIDNDAWRPWTNDANPTIADDAFLLQGHHTITVRSRVAGNYLTEDSQPPSLDALLDTVPPGLNPHVDDKNQNQYDLDGWDLVSDDDHLDYAWRDANGEMRPFSKVHTLTIDEIGRITNDGAKKLTVVVRDEAGNMSTHQLDVVQLGHGSWGRGTSMGGGCGCDLGGRGESGSTPTGAVLVVIAMGALLLRRRRATLLVLTLVGSAMLVGCGDSKHFACEVPDDCANKMCPAGQLPSCDSNVCGCSSDVSPGKDGEYASMAVIGKQVFVAAYNQTYGDLVIGNTTTPGKITSWDFVDGVPDETPQVTGSHVRGGISDPGPDVGQYASIAVSAMNTPIMASYDATNGALRFASFGAIRWHSHAVDQSAASGSTPDQVGIWTSMTVDKMGRPGIAYGAIVTANTQSGKPEGQLRFAQANTPDPQAPTDWTITVVDSRPLPAMPTATNGLLPDSIAIMTTSARRSDGTPVIAYYDRLNGNLRLAQQDTAGKWTTGILDGQAPDGTDTGDVGQFPSMTLDASDVAYISYVDASRNNLLFIDTKNMKEEIADDGYRADDETTNDGLASPVYHLVGDSSSIAVSQGKVFIAYQDSTAVELRLANRDASGNWTTQTIAGHAVPFTGSYGFWAGIALSGSGAYLGSYAIDQQSMPTNEWYETFFVDFKGGPVQ